jgi:hypothetical protein
MNGGLSILHPAIPALVPARGHAGIQWLAARAGKEVASTTGIPFSLPGRWGVGEKHAATVRASSRPLSLTLSPEGRGDVVSLGFSALGKGKSACITISTPSPLKGEGGGEGERREAAPPSSVRTMPTPTLSFPEPRGGRGLADFRLARRSAFSFLLDSGVCRNDVLREGLQ